MLSNSTGKLIFDSISDYIVLDLETTGINTQEDDVIEISALKVIGGKVKEEFSTLVNPGRHIEDVIVDITGITDSMVKDSPCFEDALKDFQQFAGDMVIIGQNVKMFDLKFINRECQRFWGKVTGNDYEDTLIIARIFLPGLESHGLGALSSYYGISTEGAHRSLNDCYMTYNVYEHLKKEMAAPSPDVLKVKRCPRCGNTLKKRAGKFGEFYRCRSFPDCRYTEEIMKER